MAKKREMPKQRKGNLEPIEDVRKFIESTSRETSIYIGCDSQCYRKRGKWYISYARVIVIHIDSLKGCKIFGDTIVLEDFKGSKKERMRQRLIQEVQYGIDLYEQIWDACDDRNLELHLDISTDESCGSNSVLKEATGWVRGVLGIEPKVKPYALAASYAADYGARDRGSVIRH